MKKIRFGAFDAVYPNGIVALGDKHSVFGVRLLTQDIETGELFYGRTIDLKTLHTSSVRSSVEFRTEWTVNGKRAVFNWCVYDNKNLYARVDFDQGLRIIAELYVPWQRRLDREWVNYSRQGERIFTGEHISPFVKSQYNAVRMVTNRAPDSCAGYNSTESEYEQLKKSGKIVNVALGNIWNDMGLWWQFGLAFEEGFSFLLSLGNARDFLSDLDESELDAEFLSAEKKCLEYERRIDKSSMSGKVSYAPVCEALRSALYFNTLYHYPSGNRYIITDRSWSKKDDDWGVIFNWDTFLSSMAASWFDHSLAKENMRCAYCMQLPDGRIPLFSRADDQRSEPQITAGRCQHIVHGLTLWTVYLHTKDKVWLKECYGKCKKVHEWWFSPREDGTPHRDPLGLGLLTFGYDPEKEMGILGSRTQPYVGKAQYAYFETYDDSPQWTTGEFFVSTAGKASLFEGECNDEATYDAEKHTATIYTLERSCLYALECLNLEKAALELGYEDDASRYRNQYERMKKTVNEKMWDDETGCYYNLRFDGTLSRVQTPDCFLPIAAGIADERQTSALMSILTDTDKFWGEFLIPSVSKDHPAYPQQKYWRGNVWPPMVYWTYLSLKRAGSAELRWEFAEKVGKMLSREWEENGYYPENFSCITGRINGYAHYNWGVLMGLPMIEEMIDVKESVIIFGNELAPVGSEICGVPFDGHIYGVRITEAGTEVQRDGKRIALSRGRVEIPRN